MVHMRLFCVILAVTFLSYTLSASSVKYFYECVCKQSTWGFVKQVGYSASARQLEVSPPPPPQKKCNLRPAFPIPS